MIIAELPERVVDGYAGAFAMSRWHDEYGVLDRVVVQHLIDLIVEGRILIAERPAEIPKILSG